MKNTLTLSVALVVAAGIWSGVGALASPQSNQRSASLPGRVRALEAKVRTLRSQVTDIRGQAACLSALPLSQYGSSTSGYYFTNDGGMTYFFTTALDVTAVNQTPGAWVAKIDPSCVSSGGLAKSSYRADREIAGAHALK